MRYNQSYIQQTSMDNSLLKSEIDKKSLEREKQYSRTDHSPSLLN